MANCPAAGFKSVHFGILLGQTAALKDRLLDRHLMPLGGDERIHGKPHR